MATRRPELGKWLLWKLFWRDSAIRPYLPATRPFSEHAMQTMINKYGSVYIKPIAGARGKSVMRAYRRREGYGLHFETRNPLYAYSLPSLLREIHRLAEHRTLIVQQDVRLARLRGRPFDIRVMMQKDSKFRWTCTGICVKVAGPHSAITNVARSHGSVVSLFDALHESLGWSATRIHALQQQLEKLGFAVCRRFEQYQPYSEIGLDVGVDHAGRIWLLEENSGPSHMLFHHLRDQSAYRLITKTAQERRRAVRQLRLRSG